MVTWNRVSKYELNFVVWMGRKTISFVYQTEAPNVTKMSKPDSLASNVQKKNSWFVR